MNIDIQAIVNAKIAEMDANKTVEKAIESTLEKAIVSAVNTALDSWHLKSDIEKKVSEQVSKVVKEIGFTAYNGFIAEKVKQITEVYCRADIAEKIQGTFNEILVLKRESVKLSEICDAYREYICDEVDDSEKYSLENFHVSIEEEERFGYLTFKFAKEKPERKYSDGENSIRFTVYRNADKKSDENYRIGWISRVYCDGYDFSKGIDFYGMSSIEKLLINVAYNKTPIIIDVESEDDIDNSYDVDI